MGNPYADLRDGGENYDEEVGLSWVRNSQD